MFKTASEMYELTRPIEGLYASKHLTTLSERIVEAMDNRSSRGQYELGVALTNLRKANADMIEVQPDTMVVFAVPDNMQNYLTNTIEKTLTKLDYVIQITKKYTSTYVISYMTIKWKLDNI